MRKDYRKNFMAEALAAVRKLASTIYGLSDNGSQAKLEIVKDLTYRDKDGIRMGDDRFQSCLLEWYCAIRRVGSSLKADFTDITKLEFTRSELALLDLEVSMLPNDLMTCLPIHTELSTAAPQSLFWHLTMFPWSR